MHGIDDHQLMIQVREGEVSKLGMLFERHHTRLFNFFLKLTGNRQASEDLVQDVFLRMLRYRHTYQSDSDFLTWAYQIARNARFDYYQKRRNEATWDVDTDERKSTDLTPVERLERKQEIGNLRSALLRLPDDKRELLVLTRFQNLKYEQIASILCCDVGTVKVRVYRAIRELGRHYHELTGERAS